MGQAGIHSRTTNSRRDGDFTFPPAAQNANAVKTKLRKQLKLAEKILKLAELTRKAETEQEKVSRVYLTIPLEA